MKISDLPHKLGDSVVLSCVQVSAWHPQLCPPLTQLTHVLSALLKYWLVVQFSTENLEDSHLTVLTWADRGHWPVTRQFMCRNNVFDTVRSNWKISRHPLFQKIIKKQISTAHKFETTYPFDNYWLYIAKCEYQLRNSRPAVTTTSQILTVFSPGSSMMLSPISSHEKVYTWSLCVEPAPGVLTTPHSFVSAAPWNTFTEMFLSSSLHAWKSKCRLIKVYLSACSQWYKYILTDADYINESWNGLVNPSAYAGMLDRTL